jgi:chromosomal replication initiation ATPase DnaA
MNMQISSKPFTSEAEYLERAKAWKRRLWAPRVAKQPEPVEHKAEVVFLTQRAPAWEWVDVHFDAHVMDFHRWQFEQGQPVKAYIKRRAAELGFTFAHMVGPDRKRPAVRARQLIMWELKTIVKPSISYPELGRVFGGRDHTTALAAVRRQAAMKAASA